MRNNLIKEWQLLTGFVLLAFAIRLFLLRYEYVVTPDGVYYALLGKNLVSGNFREGLSTYWPPLYPFLVGMFSLIFQDLEFGGRLVSVLAGSLLVIPVYLWIRDSYGKEVTFLGMFFTVVYPSLIGYSTKLLTESTYTLLFMIGILTGWSALSKAKRGLFLLTGSVFGACYLIRPEAIGYMGLMIILTLIACPFHLQFKKVVVNTLILILGFIIFSLPYTLYLHQETGRWTISEKLVHLGQGPGWFRLSEDGQSTLADELYAGNRSAGDPVNGGLKSNSPQLKTSNFSVNSIKRFIKKLKYQYEVVIPEVFPPLVILLSGVGLFRTKWSKERVKREIYLMLFLISTVIGYAFTVQESRYLVPLSPILICWISKGIVESADWLVETAESIDKKGNLLIKNQPLIRFVLVMLVLLSLMPAITYPMRSNKLEQPFELKHASLWIKNHSDSSPVIMATSPVVAFYAEGKHLYLPNEEYSVVLEYARQKKVDYIVIDDQTVPLSAPRLKFLLDIEDPAGLILLHKYEERLHRKVRIFKLI